MSEDYNLSLELCAVLCGTTGSFVVMCWPTHCVSIFPLFRDKFVEQFARNKEQANRNKEEQKNNLLS